MSAMLAVLLIVMCRSSHTHDKSGGGRATRAAKGRPTAATDALAGSVCQCLVLFLRQISTSVGCTAHSYMYKK